MTRLLIAFQLIAAQASVPGQVDAICSKKCEFLAVQSGTVRYIDEWLDRTVDLGSYVPSGKDVVPRTEAPLRVVRSGIGWDVVASAFLDHKEDALRVHLRLLAPDGKLAAMEDIPPDVEQLRVAPLAGGPYDVLAVTAYEEHVYNAETQIWLLPEHGQAKLLLKIAGDFDGFTSFPVEALKILRQTYNGIDASTKGTISEEYNWDASSRTLRLRAQ